MRIENRGRHFLKISDETIKDVYNEILRGELSLYKIAKKYNISVTTVNRIKRKEGRYGKIIRQFTNVVENNNFDLKYFKIKIKKFIKLKNLKKLFPEEVKNDDAESILIKIDSIIDRLKNMINKTLGEVDIIIKDLKKKNLLIYLCINSNVEINNIYNVLKKINEFDDFKIKVKEINDLDFDDAIVRMANESIIDDDVILDIDIDDEEFDKLIEQKVDEIIDRLLDEDTKVEK